MSPITIAILGIVILLFLILLIIFRRRSTRKKKSSLRRVNFDRLNGYQFESFCQDLLKQNGFSNVRVTQKSGDFGIDVIATKGGKKYGVQCKRYSSNVGVHAVQEAFAGAAYYDCNIPVVITNRHFTEAAKQLADQIGVRLWDRETVLKMRG